MVFDPDRRRPFPTLIIVSVLVAFCIFPGQGWIARLLPGIAGVATIDPGMTILDIPIRFPVTIDLVLLTGLFLFSYAVVILVYPSRPGMPSWREVLQRIRAVFVGVFALVSCTAIGALISYLVKDHLPGSIRTGIGSMAINADIHIPYARSGTIHLPGNIIILICFVIGAAICIGKINKEPRFRKVYRLTREQLMTPYQRMLLERRGRERQGEELRGHERQVAEVGRDLPARCLNRVVWTIEPEAVNYMPLR